MRPNCLKIKKRSLAKVRAPDVLKGSYFCSACRRQEVPVSYGERRDSDSETSERRSVLRNISGLRLLPPDLCPGKLWCLSQTQLS